MPVTNPVMLVTGSSRGIGRAIAVDLAKAGCSVAIHHLENPSGAEETLRNCVDARVNEAQQFTILKGDISRAEDRLDIVRDVYERFGRVDALVNNAGMAPRRRSDIIETTEDSFEEVLKTNLSGTFFLTQAIAKQWLVLKPEPLLSGGFFIVNMSSISAEMPSLNRIEYCVSKAGLAMLTQAWAMRLGGHGIHVIEIRPGIIRTDMTAAAETKYEPMMADGTVPQRRWGTPEDVARSCTAILTGGFPFSTGMIVHVDGGLHIHGL